MCPRPVPARLAGWPTVPGGPAGLDIRLAAGACARLLGLARLPAPPAAIGLLLPRTRSAHTIGMRFALDLVWLDGLGRVLRVDEGVPRWRIRTCRRADSVIELPAGGARRSGLVRGAQALRGGVSSSRRPGPRRGAAWP